MRPSRRGARGHERGTVIFAAPWLLLALVGLPLLWWLLRVVPPAPRQQVFPAVRLLLGLPATVQTAARTPPWLLALRVAAAGLIVLGLAEPVLHGGAPLPGRGPLLLVVDNGWAAAPDWPARLRAAQAILRRAATSGRRVALLATAPGDAGLAPPLAMPAAELGPRLAVLRPMPWPVDRAAAATAVAAWTRAHQGGGVAYLADGLTDGAAWDGFAAALRAAGPGLSIADAVPPARLLLAPAALPDGLRVTLAQVPRPTPSGADVLAQTADGRTIARLALHLPAGVANGSAKLTLPAELRNQVDRLLLVPAPGQVSGAGEVALVDEASRRRPVGVLSDSVAANTPLSGAAYFVQRALDPYAELREGNLDSLLAQKLSVLVLADHPLQAGPEADRITRWVEQGGLLLRFAGPAMAQGSADQAADPLLPVPLLGFEREMGGTMSWGKPVPLAPFAPPSPFAGLSVPADVQVSRQVLADPAGDLTQATWARLADGTPLVTQRPVGAGRVVLFHVTANADWSNLPLSGLFVDMLRRIVALSAGVAPEGLGNDAAPLAAAATLDGAGVLGPPPATASPIAARDFAAARASPTHPPGFYGPENARRALDLAANLPRPEAAPAIAGAAREAIGPAPAARPLGPFLVALAWRCWRSTCCCRCGCAGCWARPPRSAAAATLLAIGLFATPVHAAGTAGTGAAADASAALATRLAYIESGDATVDDIARAGLAGLSAYVNDRTAAVLAEPVAVTPGRDDLSFYPLLYWPLVADAPPPDAAAIGALNDYMAHGGIILIDTRDGGSGADMAPGTREVLRQLGQGGAGGLLVPPLAPLTEQHVLAHAFYLLSEFPGRYAGDTVWVARDQDRTNDSVSPVVIGGHDWAAAWATDAQGRHPYATLPGGERQRTLAYRFGVNLVMYALTGNYKGDQVHVPALLERMGQ